MTPAKASAIHSSPSGYTTLQLRWGTRASGGSCSPFNICDSLLSVSSGSRWSRRESLSTSSDRSEAGEVVKNSFLNKFLKKLSEENLGTWGVGEVVERYGECKQKRVVVVTTLKGIRQPRFRMFVILRKWRANRVLGARGFSEHLHFLFVPSL
jgi:hypothetical protein